MWPGPRPISIPSGILIYPAIWPQQIWTENWGLCPFGRGGAGSPSNTMWPGPSRYLHVKFRLDPSNRLATIHQRYRDRQYKRSPKSHNFCSIPPKMQHTLPLREFQITDLTQWRRTLLQVIIPGR